LNNRLLITGASGFVGRALVKQLIEQGFELRVAVRRELSIEGAERVLISNIDAATDWQPALKDIDCVVHLAARVHQLDDHATDPLAAYRSVNTAGSLNLATQAVRAGVRRLVYLSTAKIYGEFSTHRAFTEHDAPKPQDPYARSKWEAEQGLRDIAAQTGMQVAILRPPLVYGPGVGANFLRLMDYVAHEKWLPLDAVHNQRSLVSIENLINGIGLCIERETASGQTFNISDDEALSTPDLIRRLASALEVDAHLIPVPSALLRWGAALVGRSAEADRLLGSFAIDSTRLREQLGWQPASTDEGLQQVADWYRSSRSAKPE
jgi:UDP-glucose 4-epimerase